MLRAATWPAEALEVGPAGPAMLAVKTQAGRLLVILNESDNCQLASCWHEHWYA